MAIDWKRPEYKASLKEWDLIDCVVDEREEELQELLPELNATDTSTENQKRNEFYRERASWFGASAMTLTALVGIAFEDDPKIELPADLEYLKGNVDGTGLDLQQGLQLTVEESLKKGRSGLFTTFPAREEGSSLADRASGKNVATIHHIDAKRIINWWTVQDGAQVKLGGVVFTDQIETVEDYEVTTQEAIRELALDENVFVDRIWIKVDAKWVIKEESFPTDSAGNSWAEIPFTFVGATTNTTQMDRPPMLGLSRLNRDHYRNSADNEEGMFFAGQAQPYIDPGADAAGLHEALKQAKKDGFYIGGRQLIVGKFGFAQAEANTAVRQGMVDKVESMRAIGARFIEAGTVAKTAQQDAGEQKAQHSILSLIVSNTQDAWIKALEWASLYMGSQGGELELSKAFMEPEINAEGQNFIMGLYDRALLGPEDMFRLMKRQGMIEEDKDEEEFVEDLNERGGLIDTGVGDE